MLIRQSQSLKTISMRNEQSQATIHHFEITLKMLNESMGMCLPTTLNLKRGSLATEDSTSS